MTAIAHNPSHCHTITGVFDFYGGRDPSTGTSVFPDELWTEAYALVRYPSRWPDGLAPEDLDPTDGIAYSSEDEGWRIDYEVYSPGRPLNTLCPWSTDEICYQVRDNVYEFALGDDLLGGFGTWTVGDDGAWNGGALEVSDSPDNPSSTVEIVKSLTLPSMPENWNLGFFTADQGYFLCRLKARPREHSWIRVTFYDAVGTTDHSVWINLSTATVETSEANRAEYVERLDEYRIRFLVDNADTPQFGIRIVDGNNATELTDPVEDDGILLDSCTLQWEELDPELSGDQDDEYQALGWDIAKFSCNDDNRTMDWRRFVPLDNDYLLSDDEDHEHMVVAAPFYTFLGGLANRNSNGTSDPLTLHSFLDSRGSLSGNCVPNLAIQANQAEFLIYTGVGGEGFQDRPRTEAIVKVRGDGETSGQEDGLYIGVANTVNDAAQWFHYLEESHVPNDPPGTYVLIDEEEQTYYRPVGNANDVDQIIRLAVIFGHSVDNGGGGQDAIEGIGFIPPRNWYWESNYNADVDQFWYEARSVEDYCAITAGRCGVIPYVPGDWLFRIVFFSDPNGVVDALTDGMGNVQVLQGPSGVLWDDTLLVAAFCS